MPVALALSQPTFRALWRLAADCVILAGSAALFLVLAVPATETPPVWEVASYYSRWIGFGLSLWGVVALGLVSAVLRASRRGEQARRGEVAAGVMAAIVLAVSVHLALGLLTISTAMWGFAVAVLAGTLAFVRYRPSSSLDLEQKLTGDTRKPRSVRP